MDSTSDDDERSFVVVEKSLDDSCDEKPNSESLSPEQRLETNESRNVSDVDDKESEESEMAKLHDNENEQQQGDADLSNFYSAPGPTIDSETHTGNEALKPVAQLTADHGARAGEETSDSSAVNQSVTHHRPYTGDEASDLSVIKSTTDHEADTEDGVLNPSVTQPTTNQSSDLNPGTSSTDEQERREIEARNAENERLTEEFFQFLLDSGEAMRCPNCTAIIQKANENSDWLRCTFCKTELCWATKGRRWGPKGKGDTSGGCKCRIAEGRPCHPTCRNCH